MSDPKLECAEDLNKLAIGDVISFKRAYDVCMWCKATDTTFTNILGDAGKVVSTSGIGFDSKWYYEGNIFETSKTTTSKVVIDTDEPPCCGNYTNHSPDCKYYKWNQARMKEKLGWTMQ